MWGLGERTVKSTKCILDRLSDPIWHDGNVTGFFHRMSTHEILHSCASWTFEPLLVGWGLWVKVTNKWPWVEECLLGFISQNSKALLVKNNSSIIYSKIRPVIWHLVLQILRAGFLEASRFERHLDIDLITPSQQYYFKEKSLQITISNHSLFWALIF